MTTRIRSINNSNNKTRNMLKRSALLVVCTMHKHWDYLEYRTILVLKITIDRSKLEKITIWTCKYLRKANIQHKIYNRKLFRMCWNLKCIFVFSFLNTLFILRNANKGAHIMKMNYVKYAVIFYIKFLSINFDWQS